MLTVLPLLLLQGAWDCGGEAHAAAALAAVEAVNEDATRLLREGDAAGYAAHFAEDAVQYPPNAPAAIGREGIRQAWEGALAAGEWDLELDILDLTVCGPHAIERGAYSLAIVPADLNVPGFEDEGHYLVHWRLEGDGEWRIVSDAPVSAMPPPGMP